LHQNEDKQGARWRASMAGLLARTFDLSDLSHMKYVEREGRGFSVRGRHQFGLFFGPFAIIVGGIIAYVEIAYRAGHSWTDLLGTAMIAAFMTGVGLLFLFLAIYYFVPGATRIEVTTEGVTMYYPSWKSPRTMPWRSSEFWLKMVHYHIGGGIDTFMEDPWSCPTTYMPEDVWRGLIAEARSRGMNVNEHKFYGGYGEMVKISSQRK